VRALRQYKASTVISKNFRSAKQLRRFRTYVKASIVIQARARCRAQKARYTVQLAEAKEEAKMEVRQSEERSDEPRQRA